MAAHQRLHFLTRGGGKAGEVRSGMKWSGVGTAIA
jgi:hypothetical protein